MKMGKKITAMFLSLFALILAAAVLSMVSRLWDGAGDALFIVTEALLVVALTATLLITRYVAVKVFAPVRRITKAAEAVTLYGRENEVGDYTDADGEINDMTRSIHNMAEKLRSDFSKMEKSCAEITVKRKIDEIMESSGDVKEVFEALCVMFCEYFSIFKTTIVYLYNGKHSAFSNTYSGYFANFAKVDELLKNRKLAHFNSYSIESQKIDFLDNKTDSVCIIPLRNKELFGCVIFENAGGAVSMSENSENMMLFISETLCRCFPDKEWAEHYEGASNGGDAEESVTDKLRGLEFLDVDAALAAVGGLRDIYEQSVRVTVRLLPETIGKMDVYLADEDIKKFGIEAHGMKSVLRNIGAATLGSMAAWLENAAKTDDLDYCQENYPPFKELLLKFESEANAVIAEKVSDKGEIDKETFRAAIETALEAANSYDAVAALEAVRPLSGYAYDKDIGDCLKKTIFALEEFNCENAIKEMEVILNGGT